MLSSTRVALSIVLLALCSSAQTIHLPQRYSVVKAENGLIIGWHVATEDRQMGQIGVYDRHGSLLTELAPLRFVPEASRATVHDVSARPGGVIAVAAVFRKDKASVPAGTLLCFDSRGNLLTATALAASREAWRVAVDSESHIWTLTTSAGTLSPSEVPMFVGYTVSGSIFREVLTRSDFPAHSLETQENGTVGRPEFGSSSDGIWAWLPGSTDQVTFKSDGSSVQRSTTGLPDQLKHGMAQRVALTYSGTLLAQVWPERAARQPSQGSFVFFRSAKEKVWVPFVPPCSSCTLIGADSGNALFIKGAANGSDVYSATLPE